MSSKNEKSEKDALNILLSVLSTLPLWEESDKELVDSLRNDYFETRKRFWECRVAAQERQAAIDELRVARQSVSKHVRDGIYSALSAIDGAIARFERECEHYGPLSLDLGSRVNYLYDRLAYMDSLSDAKWRFSTWLKEDTGQRRVSVRVISAVVQRIKSRYEKMRFKDPFPKVRIPSRKSKKK